MLDRLALLMPDWRERNPADLGVALVELLAYVGDHLSYYQDAVATEAYLGTARRRVSVRRHARLLDYRDARRRATRGPGCTSDGRAPPTSTLPARDATFLTPGARRRPRRSSPTRRRTAPRSRPAPEVFETLHDGDALAASTTQLALLHSGASDECCLPAGATRATLAGALPEPAPRATCWSSRRCVGPRTGDARRRRPDAPPRRPADRGPTADGPALRRPGRRDAAAADHRDRLGRRGRAAVPALPLGDDRRRARRAPARGRQRRARQLVLADHGLTVAAEPLGAPVPARATLEPAALVVRPLRAARSRRAAGALRAALAGGAADAGGARRRGRRSSTGAGAARLRPGGSAAAALRRDLAEVLPVIRLDDASGTAWQPQRDLLGSDAFAPEFVVEIEDDGRASSASATASTARRPRRASSFTPTYRVGNGTRGQRRRRTRSRTSSRPTPASRRAIVASATRCRPRGGIDPEPLGARPPDAPAAFRTQERAVTPADYATLGRAPPGGAARRGDAPLDGQLAHDLRHRRPPRRRARSTRRSRPSCALPRALRMAGHDLEIDGPRFVPLELELVVCVAARLLPQRRRARAARGARQRRAGRRPPRRLPPRQLHLRPAGLPEPVYRRGAGGAGRRAGSSVTHVPAPRRAEPRTALDDGVLARRPARDRAARQRPELPRARRAATAPGGRTMTPPLDPTAARARRLRLLRGHRRGHAGADRQPARPARARLPRRHPRGASSASLLAGAVGRATTRRCAGSRPASDDDLAIALLDAWATVADVLTFYQERIANEGFLRTATERRSVLELARAIGYELEPGRRRRARCSRSRSRTPSARRRPTAVERRHEGAERARAGRAAADLRDGRASSRRAPEWNALRPRQTRAGPPLRGRPDLFLARRRHGPAARRRAPDRRRRAHGDPGSERWDLRVVDGRRARRWTSTSRA